MLINQTMADKFWPGQDPVGSRVTMLDWGTPLTGEVVGVVGDVKPSGPQEPVGSMIYWPYPQFRRSSTIWWCARRIAIPKRARRDQGASSQYQSGASCLTDSDHGAVLGQSLAQRKFQLGPDSASSPECP